MINVTFSEMGRYVHVIKVIKSKISLCEQKWVIYTISLTLTVSEIVIRMEDDSFFSSTLVTSGKAQLICEADLRCAVETSCRQLGRSRNKV